MKAKEEMLGQASTVATHLAVKHTNIYLAEISVHL